MVSNQGTGWAPSNFLRMHSILPTISSLEILEGGVVFDAVHIEFMVMAGRTAAHPEAGNRHADQYLSGNY